MSSGSRAHVSNRGNNSYDPEVQREIVNWGGNTLSLTNSGSGRFGGAIQSGPIDTVGLSATIEQYDVDLTVITVTAGHGERGHSCEQLAVRQTDGQGATPEEFNIDPTNSSLC